MALRLRIVSDHRRALGPRSSVVFGVTGGNIGRSADNDWVLPDPSRYVSGRHARIRFADGKFFIEDTSTNGTFLNDSDQPLPKSSPQELNNGDMIRFGEYHVVVALDADAEFGTHRNAMTGLDESLELNASQAQQVLGSLDLSLGENALFGTDDSVAAAPVPLRANSAYGQSALLGDSGPHAQRRTAAPQPSREDSDIIAAQRMERLARAVREHDSKAVDGARAGLEAFCRGAGIDASGLNDGNSAAMLQVAGRLLREAMIGLKDLDTKQAEFRSLFRLAPARDEDTEPFKISNSTDELLAKMLASHDSRRLDAGQWLRTCFEQQAGHAEGLAHGARRAIVEFLQHLDPIELERRFEAAPKRGAQGIRANNWEMYGEFYRSASEVQKDTGVPSLYSETLTSAYKDETEKP